MNTVATHSGGFHADDVFAIAAFQLLLGKENVEVVRTRDEAVLAEAEYVVDAGGMYDHAAKRYDHHQNGAPVRDNGIPYAGFGLMWKHYGEEICGSAEVANKIEEMLCVSIDASDNAINIWQPGQFDLAPLEWDDILQTWRAEPSKDEDMDQQFLKAVEFAYAYLKRVIQRAQIKLVLKQKALELYESTDHHAVLVSDEYVPRSEFIEKEDVNIVVIPRFDDNPGWCAVGVQVSETEYLTKVRFPKAWAGLRDGELAAASGIPDAIFCHKDRYMFIAKSKESAIAAAKLAK